MLVRYRTEGKDMQISSHTALHLEAHCRMGKKAAGRVHVDPEIVMAGLSSKESLQGGGSKPEGVVLGITFLQWGALPPDILFYLSP